MVRVNKPYVSDRHHGGRAPSNLSFREEGSNGLCPTSVGHLLN